MRGGRLSSSRGGKGMATVGLHFAVGCYSTYGPISEMGRPGYAGMPGGCSAQCFF